MAIHSQQPTEGGDLVSILQVRVQVRLGKVTQLGCDVSGTPVQELLLQRSCHYGFGAGHPPAWA